MRNEIPRFELNPDIEYIKIHGLQRTATNYVANLLNSNFRNVQALVNIGGWKHGYYCAPWTLGQEVHVLTVIKNPYAWLASLYDFWGPSRHQSGGPDLRGVSFDQFVRTRAIFEEQAGTPFLYYSSNPVQHWNSMNFHWASISMNFKKSWVLTYESLLKDCDRSLQFLEDFFDLKSNGKFENSGFIFNASNENPSQTNIAFDKAKYYIDKEYMKLYNPDLIKFVNQQLDKDVMACFGYELEEAQ